jgi:hypothetical protein
MAKFGSESQRPLTAQEVEAPSQPGPGAYTLPSSLSATGAPVFGKEEKCPESYEVTLCMMCDTLDDDVTPCMMM